VILIKKDPYILVLKEFADEQRHRISDEKQTLITQELLLDFLECNAQGIWWQIMRDGEYVHHDLEHKESLIEILAKNSKYLSSLFVRQLGEGRDFTKENKLRTAVARFANEHGQADMEELERHYVENGESIEELYREKEKLLEQEFALERPIGRIKLIN
jgi:hypothetical protein